MESDIRPETIVLSGYGIGRVDGSVWKNFEISMLERGIETTSVPLPGKSPDAGKPSSLVLTGEGISNLAEAEKAEMFRVLGALGVKAEVVPAEGLTIDSRLELEPQTLASKSDYTSEAELLGFSEQLSRRSWSYLVRTALISNDIARKNSTGEQFSPTESKLAKALEDRVISLTYDPEGLQIPLHEREDIRMPLKDLNALVEEGALMKLPGVGFVMAEVMDLTIRSLYRKRQEINLSDQ